MTEDSMSGIEQGRAKYAYDKVQKVTTKESEKLQKQYKSYAKKLPVLIKTNGLGQALVFMQIKNLGSEKLYQQISDWLGECELINSSDDMIGQVVSMNSFKYRQATNEVLAFMNWVRRFVDGLMAKVEEEN